MRGAPAAKANLLGVGIRLEGVHKAAEELPRLRIQLRARHREIRLPGSRRVGGGGRVRCARRAGRLFGPLRNRLHARWLLNNRKRPIGPPRPASTDLARGCLLRFGSFAPAARCFRPGESVRWKVCTPPCGGDAGRFTDERSTGRGFVGEVLPPVFSLRGFAGLAPSCSICHFNAAPLPRSGPPSRHSRRP